MTAPTPKTGSEVMDFKGLAIKCSQIQTDSGAVMVGAQAATVAALTDNAAGATADGTIAAITDLSTADTYTDAAVNAKLVLIRDAVKELSTKINAIITALKDAGVVAS